MTKRTSIFSAVLIAVVSLAAGLVLASRLDLTPASGAQTQYTVPGANSDPITGAIDATTFRRIAQQVSPAVVSIRTTSTARRREMTDFYGELPFFPQGPRGRQQQPQRTSSSGSGFIIDAAKGLVLTNNHVVEGAEEIDIAFYGDRVQAQGFKAKIVGRDPLTDSALLQLTERPDHQLTQVAWGDSDQIAPGDWVVAIGNPFSLRHTVTVGVVSALGRDQVQQVNGRRQEMIQTDAAINPGNSGGPLLNVRGEVIGINSAIYTNQTQANLGIGFAVPINAIRNLLPQLQTGRITRGKVGISVSTDPTTPQDIKDFGLPSTGGALVTSIDPGGAAAKAGLQDRDWIIEFNGRPVHSDTELVSMVMATRPGTTVPMKIVRNGQQRTLNVTVDALDMLADEDAPQQARQTTQAGFGITLEPLTPAIARQLQLPSGVTGVVVSDVAVGSAAERGGLTEGDVITNINGRPVRSADEASSILEQVGAGSRALVTIYRQGEPVTLSLRRGR